LSKPEHRLYRLPMFAFFLIPSRQMLTYYLKLDNGRFLPNPVKVITGHPTRSLRNSFIPLAPTLEHRADFSFLWSFYRR
jgi:hypothetical protein